MKHRGEILDSIEAIKVLYEVMLEPAINYLGDRPPAPGVLNYLLQIITKIHANALGIA